MAHNVFIILWKDLLLRKNHYLATTCEIFIPILLILLINLTIPKIEHEVNNNPISFDEIRNNQCNIRHSHYDKIIFEPSTSFTNNLMSKAACYAGYQKKNVIPRNLQGNNSYFSIGVKFDIDNSTLGVPTTLNYTLYPTNELWIYLHYLWRFSSFTLPKYSIPFMRNVIELQRAVDVSFMHIKNISTKKVNLENTDFFDRNPQLFSISVYLTFFLAFSLMIPPIISRVIQDKFTGAKEMMLMMGVQKWELWIAKLMDSFLITILSVSGMVFLLYVPLKESSNVLNISPVIFWCTILYGLISVILFLFFMSCFFQKSTLAVYVTEIIWVLSFILKNLIFQMINIPLFIKYFICIFPHITLMIGISVFLDFNSLEKELKFWERLSGRDDYLPLNAVLAIMTFNIIFYSVLTWYVEQIKPGNFGVPKPYGFCFKMSYWKPNRVNFSNNTMCLNNTAPDGFELVPPSLRQGIHIQNVTKIYRSLEKGFVTAVDDVSIDFYCSEISALLGHNGAGKTTIFSIITGLTYPTRGKVFINGQDLSLNILEARRSLGLCPQKDMLFNDLTAVQILKFYGMIKGLRLKDATDEAKELLVKLKLNNVEHTKCSDLSGGQKRKVSLAIALIGGSEVLILDEPTSGMDPEIRREIWEILLGLRGSKTILITTHFMEEADALCDRIAIMDSGKIKCYGSSMFLKSKYGRGYILSVVVENIGQISDITNYVKQFIPAAKFRSQNIRTVSYELPESESINFPALLSGLDDKQNEKKIVSYSISVATLEDVFLRLKNEGVVPDDPECTDSVPYVKFADKQDLPPSKITGCFLFLYQFCALLVKKWIYFRRTYKTFLLYSVLPMLIIALSTLASQNNSKQTNKISYSKSAPLEYSVDLYAPFLVLYSDGGNGSDVNKFPEYMRNRNCEVRLVPDVKKELYNIFSSDYYVYSRKALLGVDFTPDAINIFHNDDAVHLIPVALNLIHNFVLKNYDVNSGVSTLVSAQLVHKEQYFIPKTILKCSLEEIPDFSGIQTFFYFLSPLKEGIFGSKEIQLMMTPPSIYWLSHLVFDTLTFIFYIIVICLLLGFTQGSDYMSKYADEISMSLFLWGIGMILVAYVISSIVKNEARAFSVSVVVYVICTFVFNNPISSLGLPKWVQYLHPTCILKVGYSDLCAGFKTHYILALFLYNLLLFGFLVISDSKYLALFFHRLLNRFIKVDYTRKANEGELVEEEKVEVEKLILKKKNTEFSLIVDDLKRWYLKAFKASPAVRGISFKVNKGECFGLLGVNGAGKTSTFKMLTGSIPSSCGTTFVRSERLSLFNRQKYLFQIGYCPQSGGLIPSYRGRELLKIFAYLRGIRKSQVDGEVNRWLQKLDLTDFADRSCETYSGGNQRKLSTALSLIGNSHLIFLDEPTSGVDPAARRIMWNVIDEAQKMGQAVVLTSHSMDECEALCSRLAIMVEGKFRCLGEITTLKKCFGQGYCVQLKVSYGVTENSVLSLKNLMTAYFGQDCRLVDEHLTILQYHVANTSISWPDVFSKLKALKDNCTALESYTASETTLEQIFIYFARNR